MAKDGLWIYIGGLVTALCAWGVNNAANEGDMFGVVTLTIFTCLSVLSSLGLIVMEGR